MINRNICHRFFSYRHYSLLCKVFLLMFYASLPKLSGEGISQPRIKLRLSPLYSTGLSIRLRGSSYAAQLANSRHSLAAVFTLPEVQYGYADRNFLDGYIHRDPGTGNSGSLVPDSTWFWGYAKASQYDPLEQTLSFHRLIWGQQQDTSVISHSHPERVSEQTSSALGLELSAEYPLLTGNYAQLGLQLAWLFFSDWDWQQQHCNYKESLIISNRLLEILETYYYNVRDTALPSAGHTGTYLGPFDTPPLVPSTIIPNRPSSILQEITGNSIPIDSQIYHYRNRVSYKLACDQHEFRLGPSLRYLLLDNRLVVTLAPSASLALLSLTGKRQETLLQGDRTVVASWRDHKHRYELLAGLAVSFQLEYQCPNGWFVGWCLAYYWYPQEPSISLGPGRISLQANKLTLAATLGYNF